MMMVLMNVLEYDAQCSRVAILLGFPSDCNHQESICCHHLGRVVDHLDWYWVKNYYPDKMRKKDEEAIEV